MLIFIWSNLFPVYFYLPKNLFLYSRVLFRFFGMKTQIKRLIKNVLCNSSKSPQENNVKASFPVFKPFVCSQRSATQHAVVWPRYTEYDQNKCDCDVWSWAKLSMNNIFWFAMSHSILYWKATLHYIEVF